MQNKTGFKAEYNSTKFLLLKNNSITFACPMFEEVVSRLLTSYFLLLTSYFFYAQVAEMVDALVSNTSGSNTVPVRARLWVQTFIKAPVNMVFSGVLIYTGFNDFIYFPITIISAYP